MLKTCARSAAKKPTIKRFCNVSRHTVWNYTGKVSLSLHTYGKHINFTGRSEFDPEAKTEKQFVVTVD
jgi:hypothetical protein